MGGNARSSHPVPARGLRAARPGGSRLRSGRFAGFVALGLTLASATVVLPAPAALAAPTVPAPATPAPKPPTVGPIPGLTPPPTNLAQGIRQATRLRQQIAANSRRADVLDEKFLEAQTAVRKAMRRSR